MRLNNSEDTASKLVVSILDMESFFGFILSDSMIFNSFFNYTFICKKLVSELRRFGTTVLSSTFISRLKLVSPAPPDSGEGKENALIFVVAYIGSGGVGRCQELS